MYVVSYVYPQDRQDSQGQDLHQLSPRRIRKHSQRSAAKDSLFTRQLGASSPRALAGPGAPSASELGRTALAAPRRGSASHPGEERPSRTKAASGVIQDQ